MKRQFEFIAYVAPQLISRIGDPDGELERQVGTWIAYAVRFAKRYEVQDVDAGNDCSARVVPSDDDLASAPLATVADFLEQPNGHSIATYVPGCGIDAARYADELSEQVSEVIHTLVLTLVAEAPEPIRAAFEATDRDYEDLVQIAPASELRRGAHRAVPVRRRRCAANRATAAQVRRHAASLVVRSGPSSARGKAPPCVAARAWWCRYSI